MVVMTARVWVSSSMTSVTAGADGPGGDWEEIGTIDSSRETELWNQVQTALGYRSTAAPSQLEAYIDGDPDSLLADYASAGPEELFWLAIDIFGDGEKWLVTAERAAMVRITRRVPEAHPGLLRAPKFIGVRLRKGPTGLFHKHFADNS
jgi:hypothetical protein